VLSVADLTRIRQAEQQILHHAFHDGLTGLPNRLYLLDRLTDLIERQGGSGDQLALIIVDVDRFSVINDGLGHLVGDQLLRAVAERLEATIDPTDTLTSLGGDTFGVVVESEGTTEEVVAAATLLRSAFIEPFSVGDHELHCTASMGIVTSGQGESADDLLRNAAAALEHARQEGRNRWVLFTDAMSEDANRVFRVEQALRRALAASELRLHLQPVHELEGLRIAGFEALLRWEEPSTGLLEPAQFLSVAEDSGLIVPIGEWTITKACRQVARWQRTVPQSTARIGVNLSYQQLASSELVRTVRASLEATGIDPGRLVLEVNQTALMRDPERAVDTVERLRELGVRLCLDNFGTGASVLAHAHRFPFEMIKIDRSFLIGIGDDALRWKVVERIHSLARQLADRVVVQGVEHEDQLSRLADLGCVLVQGRLLAPPVEPKDAEHLLTPA
jgi:diguanylate cyclase (GGDEF)-like protein